MKNLPFTVLHKNYDRKIKCSRDLWRKLSHFAGEEEEEEKFGIVNCAKNASKQCRHI
jgi:hypothetical protein